MCMKGRFYRTRPQMPVSATLRATLSRSRDRALHLSGVSLHVHDGDRERIAEIHPREWPEERWNQRRVKSQRAPVVARGRVHPRDECVLQREKLLEHSATRCSTGSNLVGRRDAPRTLERPREEAAEQRGLPFAEWRAGVRTRPSKRPLHDGHVLSLGDDEVLEDLPHTPSAPG